METTETTELSRVLRAATEDIEPRTGFAPDVLRGGRRRRFRRRAALSGTLAAVVAATGISVSTALRGDAPVASAPSDASGNDRSIPMVSAATRGDLAGDQAYLGAAEAAFRAGLPATVPDAARVGAPHVYWAGTTPAGRAAVVAWQVTSSAITGDDGARILVTGGTNGSPATDLKHVYEEARGVLVGLVLGDRPALIGLRVAPGGDQDGPAFLFGEGDRFLLTVNTLPLSMSTRLSVGPDGTTARGWTGMTEYDGAWFGTMGGPVVPGDVRVAYRPGAADMRNIHVTEASGPAGHPRLQRDFPAPALTGWPTDDPIRLGGSQASEEVAGLGLITELAQAGFTDPIEPMSMPGFRLIADVPGGGSVIAVEYAPDFAGGPRLYLGVRGLGPERWLFCGPLDAKAVLPVSVLLPDGKGRLVAALGAQLRYRSTVDGAWTDAGKDGAILPATATQVEVTEPGQAPQMVTLR